MTIRYDVPGSKRKNLANEIAKWLCADVQYLGAPSFAYKIGELDLDFEGNLIFNTEFDNQVFTALLEHLSNEGYECIEGGPSKIADSGPKTESTNDTDEAITAAQSENAALTVTIPREFFTDDVLQNLKRLIDAKGNLIKKALAIDSLPIEADDDKVSFSWFSDGQDEEEISAYTHFIAALCSMARNQKRVTAKEKPADNEKYAFRCFLLRLGFIGSKYKKERKILLSRLDGNSAFKNGAKKKEEPIYKNG